MISASEMARRMRVSRQRVHQLIEQQRVPHFRIGRSVFIDELDAAAFIRRHAVEKLAIEAHPETLVVLDANVDSISRYFVCNPSAAYL